MSIIHICTLVYHVYQKKIRHPSSRFITPNGDPYKTEYERVKTTYISNISLLVLPHPYCVDMTVTKIDAESILPPNS